MKLSLEVPSRNRTELFSEALSRRLPIILTYRGPQGWATSKTHILAIDAEADQLVLAYPTNAGNANAPVPEIVAGQSVGLAFRRGHKKCVCDTVVQSRCQHPTTANAEVPALRLARPTQLHELQRRLFYRTPAPAGTNLPVDFWAGTSEQHRPDDANLYRGTMLDLSAGGISLAVPRDACPRFKTDDPVICAFAAEKGDPPLQICSRFRHTEAAGGDQVRVGLQFVGLDASAQGRADLQRIARLALKFQRLEERSR